MLIAIPTLLVISFIIFAILDLAPNDPTGNLPMTVPPEVREKIRESLGLGQPMHVRFGKWLVQFCVNEPLNFLQEGFGISIGDSENRTRIISWSTRSPVVDLIIQRTPQTLWVVGLSYLFGILIAIPIGIISAFKQYSWFDQVGTFITMVGFSVPTFFTGMVAIIIFSVQLKWFPMIYDTTLEVNSWDNFILQVKQMLMPVSVLALYNASQLSRFMRASILDNLNLDYVRTARAKGRSEQVVLLIHVLRNSLIPVVTWYSHSLQRGHHYRTNFQGQWSWATTNRCNRRSRCTSGTDFDIPVCCIDCNFQSHCRHYLRDTRSKDKL